MCFLVQALERSMNDSSDGNIPTVKPEKKFPVGSAVGRIYLHATADVNGDISIIRVQPVTCPTCLKEKHPNLPCECEDLK